MLFSARLVTTCDPSRIGRSRSKRAGGVSAASGTSSGVEEEESRKVIVKVQPTQTLSDVSKENEVSVRDIVRLNGLGTRRTLRVGEELIVSDFSGYEEDVKVIERAELLTVKTKTKEKEKRRIIRLQLSSSLKMQPLRYCLQRPLASASEQQC